MSNPENWKRMMFKGRKVYLLVDEKNNPLLRSQKATIKYQVDHDYEYKVSPQAVTEIDTEKLLKQGTAKKPIPQKQQPIPEGAIIIYTDGAASGNPGPAGIGVHFRCGDKEKEISSYIGVATNNIAELTAIKTALEQLKVTNLPVRIHTDSKYCQGLLMLGWKPKANKELVESIKHLMRKFKDIMILKVEGHSGVPGNERADKLARTAVETNMA
ncbi:MAG: ribonuclease H [Pseudomonadota bacterium]